MLGWLVRRRTSAGEGMVLYLDREGVVHELGVYTPDQLTSLRWGIDVAYRVSRERAERIRLGRVRLVAHRLGEAARRLPEHKVK